MAVEIKFVPKVCGPHKEIKMIPAKVAGEAMGQEEVDVEATFEGHIMLRGNTYDERMEMLEANGIMANSKGEVTDTSISVISELRKLVKKSKDHYLSVHLKRLKDGKEFKSFDEMSEDPDCDAILSEVGFALRQGFRPGKN